MFRPLFAQRGSRIHKRHWVVGFERKTRVIHKRDISKRGGDPVRVSCSSIRAFASEDTFQGGCAGWYMISFQIPCFSPAVRSLRNTCSYIRLKAIPPSGHPCRLPRFVQPNRRCLAFRFEHAIQVAVCTSPTRSPNCALAPVRLIKFLSVIASRTI